jgi:hypothetical protein
MPVQNQAVPPKLDSRASLGLFATAIFAFVGLAAAAVLFFFDPSKNHFYPVCQFHLLTGLYCPGCGATRASYQLLHGNFLAALHDNALFIAVLLALAARGIWYLNQRRSGRSVRFFIPPYALWIFLAVALVFAVLRNLPAFSYLSPLAR